MYEYQRFIFLRKLLLQGDLKTTCAVDAADLTDLRIIQSKYGFKTDDSINVLKRKSWLLFTNVIDSIWIIVSIVYSFHLQFDQLLA